MWIGIGGGVLAVVALVGGLTLSRANWKAEAYQARAEVVVKAADLSAMQSAYESQRAAVDELKAIDAAKDRVLAEQVAENRRLEAERVQFEHRWKEVLRNEKSVRDWADEPVPDAVRRLLGEQTAAADSGDAY